MIAVFCILVSLGEVPVVLAIAAVFFVVEFVGYWRLQCAEKVSQYADSWQTIDFASDDSPAPSEDG